MSYGGENGFNQAIELSAESLSNVKFVQEKKLISKFFDCINMDNRRYCYGVENTLKGLEQGAIETLILYENLETSRYTLKDPQTGVTKVVVPTAQQEADPHFLRDPTSGVEMEVVEKIPLSEWLSEHYKDSGALLEFVTNKSQEGSQFVKGFGGIGGLLRYPMDFEMLDLYEDDDFWED